MIGFTRSYLGQLWDRLQSSFWFLPSVSALLGILVAHLLMSIDNRFDSEAIPFSSFVLSSSADQLRVSMIALAGTTLTTTGIVFTLLTLPLSVVAAQFGSRLLRIYLRDRTTQVVLAVFTMTFVYCILVALLIPPTSVNEDPPSISASFGLFLAVCCFASLILLIHHVGVSLQAPSVIASASRELQRAVHQAILASNREDEVGDETVTLSTDLQVRTEGKPIHALALGYVQFVDLERLLPLTSARDVVLRMECRPGDFVEPGDLIAYAWPPDKVSDSYRRRVQRCILIGNNRLPMQDLRYAVLQLTEIGERALSQAINDPFTAMTVIDHQMAGLALYGERVRDHALFYDHHDRLRVILPPTNFSELIELAFNMPRLALGNNVVVYLHMLDAFGQIGRRTAFRERIPPLLAQIDHLKSQVEMLSLPSEEKRMVIQKCADVSQSLNTQIANGSP